MEDEEGVLYEGKEEAREEEEEEEEEVRRCEAGGGTVARWQIPEGGKGREGTASSSVLREREGNEHPPPLPEEKGREGTSSSPFCWNGKRTDPPPPPLSWGNGAGRNRFLILLREREGQRPHQHPPAS